MFLLDTIVYTHLFRSSLFFKISDDFSFSIREKVAARSDEGPVGMIKITMGLSRWRKVFPKLGFSGSLVLEMNKIQPLGAITSKEEAWVR